MRMFRRLWALRRAGRTIGAQSGAEPRSRGGRSAMLGRLEETMAQVQQSQADAERLATEGLPGIGIVRGMSTPVPGSLMYNQEIDLEVRVEGREPYRVSNQYMVSRDYYVVLGGELPIRVDPNDPSRIAIDWVNAPQRPKPGEIRPVEE